MLHIPLHTVIRGPHRNIIIVNGHTHIVVYTQPRTYFQATFRPEIILLETFVADAIDALRTVETAGDVVVGKIITAGDGDIVLGGRMCFPVELLHPVMVVKIGIAKTTDILALNNLRQGRIILSAFDFVVNSL